MTFGFGKNAPAVPIDPALARRAPEHLNSLTPGTWWSTARGDFTATPKRAHLARVQEVLKETYGIEASAHGNTLLVKAQQAEKILSAEPAFDGEKTLLHANRAQRRAAAIAQAPAELPPLSPEETLAHLNKYSGIKWSHDTNSSSAHAGLMVSQKFPSKNVAADKQRYCASRGLPTDQPEMAREHVLTATAEDAARFVEKRRLHAAQKDAGMMAR